MLIDHLQAALEVGNDAVLQLGHARQIALAPGRLEFGLGLLDLLLDLRRALHLGLLGLPDLLEIGIFLFELDHLFLEFGQALHGRLVVFLLQRLALDLQLDQPPIQAVERLGLGVDFHADAAGGLVDQVDGLVRQLAIGDVAMRQLGRRDDGAVSDADAVVNLIALLEAAQDGDGVLLARLFHQHFLEAALQRGVLLDVLAILIERGRAHAVQFATRQGRLEHVAGVHGALGLAGADHGMQLVDEKDHAPFLLAQFVEHGLQALLELAAELGAGNQRAHVQRQQTLVLEAIGHLAVDDALRQPFDDGGLADARLADQHRVVLGAALQHLDGAADFVVTPDHWVQTSLLGTLGHVDGVLVESLARFLGVGVVDRFATAQVGDGVLQRLLAHALSQ